MSPSTQGVIVLVVTLAVLLSGAPVAFGLGALSIAFIVIFQGFGALHVVAETFFHGLNDFTLVSIPMFFGCLWILLLAQKRAQNAAAVTPLETRGAAA